MPIRTLKGSNDAAPILEQTLALDPRHAAANFCLGRYRLEQDDPRGIDLIETAIAADPALTQQGCNLMYAHFNRTGQKDKLRPLEHRVDQFQELAAQAQRERSQISADDRFIPHALDNGQTAALAAAFAIEPDIVTAGVARKNVRIFPNSPCYVMALRLRVSMFKLRTSSADQQLVQRVIQKIRLPGCYLVFVADKNRKTLGESIFEVSGAEVYHRPRP
jgi:hypothetical protein